MRQGSRQRVAAWLRALGAGLTAAIVPATTVSAQSPADQAQVSAWASGGTSTTAQPGDKDGKPAGGAGPGVVPFWQAPALPSAVVRGGAIPPGWQPQAVPYQGIGPDGRPMTMYVAPTYVFTYQAGPPVLALPGVSRPQAPGAPPVGGWNNAMSAGVPVRPGVPQPTVARYPPNAYQFPADSRALSGTPITPPPGVPGGAAAAATATAASPPPPTQWAASSAPSPAAAPPPSGDWMAVVPPAVAGAAIAANSASVADAAPATTAPPLASVAPTPPAAPASSADTPSPSTRAANSHLWRVVGVLDGDTVTCLDENNQQQKIRLAEIDAPEIGQDYGKVSREALAGMVFGKTVEVVDEGRDRYGRWIGHLVVDGVDVNRQMVATGNAWHYAAYSSDQSLASVQTQAQSQRLGLWAQPDPMPPWEFRKNAKKTG